MFRTTQMLRQQSRQLVRASIGLIRSIKYETDRSHEILREAQRAVARGRGDYDWDVEISVHELLLAFPPQGEWMLPPERYKRILNDLFDSGTTLIQERINATEDGELLDWLVRDCVARVSKRSDCGNLVSLLRETDVLRTPEIEHPV